MNRRPSWRIFAAAWFVFHCDPGYRSVRAQGPSPPAYQLKPVFIYNFAKFVEWPAETFSSPTDPIVIGLIGENPFNLYLEEATRGKTINNRPFVVKRVRLVGEARSCHVLFVADS